MFQLLTEYLLLSRRVSIPHLGTLTLQRQPARWNVVDQQMLGPVYEAGAEPGTEPEEAQLAWIASSLDLSPTGAEGELERFGMDLRRRLFAGSISWPGLGELQWEDGALCLRAAAPDLPALDAGRVIREDALHRVLVGEQELAVEHGTGPVADSIARQDAFWLRWLIVFLAALFIVYCLYTEAFSPQASGLKTTLQNTLP